MKKTWHCWIQSLESEEELQNNNSRNRHEYGTVPSAAHLCSWAGLCPGHNESAGKQKSARTRKGNQKLRSSLIEAARAASRAKGTYLSSQYHRIAARRGANRAAVAVAHSILIIVYHILKQKQPYIELGPTYYEEKSVI
ncbi:transposase IS116/IS110/IS902 family protein [Thermoanaerobacter ethanolicus JW 200]|nr:transposase IS116/IS110/IS902 family protein [Thermoanaerobacter ethanolicus JW 200]